MKKRHVKLIVCPLFMCMISLNALAHDFIYNNITYTVIDENAKTCMTKEGTYVNKKWEPGNYVVGSLILPSHPKDGEIEYRLTEIGSHSFFGCSELENITIPNSVTSLKTSAFRKCSKIKSFDIPSSVTHLGTLVFADCDSLETLVIPNTVTNIGNALFSQSVGLKSVVLPEGLTTIPKETFYYCSNLQEVNIPMSVTSIGFRCFYGCDNLKYIMLPPSVSEVGVNGIGLQTKCVYPSSITQNMSADNCFSYPVDNYVIENGAIYNLNRDTLFFALPNVSGDIVIPETVKTLGSNAFSYCNKITGVKIPMSVTSIGDECFYGCWMRNIVIPPSVTQLGKNAISARKCVYPSTLTPSNNSFSYPVDNCVIENGAIYNLNRDTLFYALPDIFGDFIIPETVSTIGSNAFSYCDKLTGIKIPNSVTRILNYAFEECRQLQNVTLPSSLNHIKHGTFYNCSSLKKIEIPNSVTRIMGWSFSNCTALEEIVIPNSVTFIGTPAFAGDTNLKKVIFGSSLKEIGSNSFENCALTDIVLPPSLEKLLYRAFANNKLKSITLGSNLKKVWGGAFEGNNNIEEIIITAPTPPEAEDNSVFSNYNTSLYVVDKDAKEAYMNATVCWNNFKIYEIIPAEKLEIDGDKVIYLSPGETHKLNAVITPSDTSVPQVFWRSTNDKIATVDNYGNVTLVENDTKYTQDINTRSDEEEDVYDENECDIIAETLFSNVPVAKVTIRRKTSGLDGIMDNPTYRKDEDIPTNIFNMQGCCIKSNASKTDIESLAPGLYIIGSKKVMVK